MAREMSPLWHSIFGDRPIPVQSARLRKAWTDGERANGEAMKRWKQRLREYHANGMTREVSFKLATDQASEEMRPYHEEIQRAFEESSAEYHHLCERLGFPPLPWVQ